MYVTDRVPPEAAEKGDLDARDDGIVRQLIALVVIVALTIAAVFACNYTREGMVCPAHVTAASC
jgi:hypothetical protein